MVDPEKLEQARQMLASGAGWTELGRFLGVDRKTAQQRLDPVYRLKKVQRQRIRRATLKTASVKTERLIRTRVKTGTIVKETAEQALYNPVRDGEFKPETLTAYLMGDPPPGRRELLAKM